MVLKRANARLCAKNRVWRKKTDLFKARARIGLRGKSMTHEPTHARLARILQRAWRTSWRTRTVARLMSDLTCSGIFFSTVSSNVSVDHDRVVRRGVARLSKLSELPDEVRAMIVRASFLARGILHDSDEDPDEGGFDPVDRCVVLSVEASLARLDFSGKPSMESMRKTVLRTFFDFFLRFVNEVVHASCPTTRASSELRSALHAAAVDFIRGCEAVELMQLFACRFMGIEGPKHRGIPTRLDLMVSDLLSFYARYSEVASTPELYAEAMLMPCFRNALSTAMRIRVGVAQFYLFTAAREFERVLILEGWTLPVISMVQCGGCFVPDTVRALGIFPDDATISRSLAIFGSDYRFDDAARLRMAAFKSHNPDLGLDGLLSRVEGLFADASKQTSAFDAAREKLADQLATAMRELLPPGRLRGEVSVALKAIMHGDCDSGVAEDDTISDYSRALLERLQDAGLLDAMDSSMGSTRLSRLNVSHLGHRRVALVCTVHSFATIVVGHAAQSLNKAMQLAEHRVHGEACMISEVAGVFYEAGALQTYLRALHEELRDYQTMVSKMGLADNTESLVLVFLAGRVACAANQGRLDFMHVDNGMREAFMVLHDEICNMCNGEIVLAGLAHGVASVARDATGGWEAGMRWVRLFVEKVDWDHAVLCTQDGLDAVIEKVVASGVEAGVGVVVAKRVKEGMVAMGEARSTMGLVMSREMQRRLVTWMLVGARADETGLPAAHPLKERERTLRGYAMRLWKLYISEWLEPFMQNFDIKGPNLSDIFK